MRRLVPFEIWDEQTWDIYDPMKARLIAKFYDEAAARKYLKWLNKKNPVEGK